MVLSVSDYAHIVNGATPAKVREKDLFINACWNTIHNYRLLYLVDAPRETTQARHSPCPTHRSPWRRPRPTGVGSVSPVFPSFSALLPVLCPGCLGKKPVKLKVGNF